MKTNVKGIGLILEFEGFRSSSYLCPAGVWTIGYGATRGVKKGDIITMYDAKERLKRELVEYEQAVLAALTLPPNENEFSSCVVLAYNIGIAGFKSSSVVKAHNRGDKEAAARAFNLWNKATIGGVKKTLPGLTRRRLAEAALYLTPVAQFEVDMPQAIEPERPMTASTINRASALAGGTAGIAAISETVKVVNEVKYGVSQLGDWLLPALLVAVVALAGYIVWERLKQRREGFA